MPIAGRIVWTDTESAMAGVVRAHLAFAWPESLLTIVGEADDSLRNAVLSAQIREANADDKPLSPIMQQVIGEFRSLQALCAAA